MSERRWLQLILFTTLVLGIVYALVTPPFEASDELWHFPMVEHLAKGNPLPVQDPANVGPWKQEASQPPLYYYLGAALTFWIDTSDMATVRWLNPHVDNGVLTPDGNTNLAIHDPSASRWRGTLLAVTIVRFASVLLGTATVYLTFRLGKLISPDRPELALGAAAFNGFTPMFLFISGAVNNDNLALPLTSLGLLLMARQVGRWRYRHEAAQPTLRSLRENRSWLLLGVTIGLAALTKEGTLALIPLAWGTVFVAEWQAQDRRTTARGLGRALAWSFARFLWVLLPVLLIAGWWYWRNVQLYGDWLGWSAFLDVLGRRAHPASLGQLWDERWGFLLSYWGLFGGVNIPLPTWVYYVLNTLLVIGTAGFPIFAWKRWRRHRSPVSSAAGIGKVMTLVEREFPLVLCLLLSLAVVYGLINWATETWSSQGRLVFTAISALNILLVLGLAGWLPARPARAVIGTAGIFLLAVSAAAPFAVIRPAYLPHKNEPALPVNTTALNFGGQMLLAGYELEPPLAEPGQSVTVRLHWEVVSAMSRDWSVFVHLNDPVVGVPIAQRDMYPGQGLLATRLLQPGDRLVERYVLNLPATAIAPADLQLVVGLYDFANSERLQLTDGTDAAYLDTVRLEPASDALPNQVEVRFEDQLQLKGFELSGRRITAGEDLTLTLTWTALEPLAIDYTFFAQVIGDDNHRWAAVDVPGETSRWQPGELQEVVLHLATDPITPGAVYPLIIGVYTRTPDGGFDRLQTVTAEGRLTDDIVELTLVRVDR